MNNPPIVGVDSLSRCNRLISAESHLIGSRKRHFSQAIHRGPNATASRNPIIAASDARSVILPSAADTAPGNAEISASMSQRSMGGRNVECRMKNEE